MIKFQTPPASGRRAAAAAAVAAAIVFAVARMSLLLLTLLLLLLPPCPARATPWQALPYFGQTVILVEAENFSVTSGWAPKAWGDGNHFASTVSF